MTKCICHVTDKATGEQYEIKDAQGRSDLETFKRDTELALGSKANQSSLLNLNARVNELQGKIDTIAVLNSRFDEYVNGTLTEVTEQDLYGSTSVKDYAFYKQTNLVTVTLPSTIREIGAQAFGSCSNLTLFNFNTDNLIKFDLSAFNNTPRFSKALLLKDTTQVTGKITAAGFSHVRLGGILNPTFSGEVIGGGCPNLVYLEFNEGVTALGGRTSCVSGTMFKTKGKAVFPSTLQSMGNENFRYGGVKTVVLKAVTPPLITEIHAFGMNGPDEMYVPYQSIEIYKTTDKYSTIASIIYPLVNSIDDLATIDTTTYTKVCINDSTNYCPIYNYVDGIWTLEV